MLEHLITGHTQCSSPSSPAAFEFQQIIVSFAPILTIKAAMLSVFFFAIETE